MKRLRVFLSVGVAAIFLSVCSAAAQSLPKVTVQVGESGSPAELSTTLQIVLLLTVLALAPSILIMVTSFIRIIIVLSFLRHAMGTPQMPPNQLLAGLALILTFFIMGPVADKAYNEGLKPYLDKQISGEEAYKKAVSPFEKFMLAQTREQDLALFVNIAKLPAPNSAEDIPLHVLVPAFVISELRTGFQIAFVIFIPFLVIDMVVSSVLMSMGMLMLPPVVVSLPFKILLFVLVDGWYLLVKSLVESFKV
ncbi:MAG: flagellar type III secretion system pore protein FliP [candidate division Zixibacteria bacterium]|nr:flagellar type III secretion system pore protein FliP [candidate division Zixibacteria bacterium]